VAVANDHPLFGVGPGLFERGFLMHNFPAPEGSRPTRYGMRSAHAHSEFLQMAAETGWPGLALFLWAVLSVWIPVWKRKSLDWTQEVALGAFTRYSFNASSTTSSISQHCSGCFSHAWLPLGATQSRRPCAGLRPGSGCRARGDWRWPQWHGFRIGPSTVTKIWRFKPE